MKLFSNKSNFKKWQDMSREEKKTTLLVLSALGIFIIFWLSSGFLAALGMTMIFGSLYVAVKAFKNKGSRAKYIIGAIVLFIIGGVVLPPSRPNKQTSDSQKTSVVKPVAKPKMTDNEKSKLQLQETERLAKEKAESNRKEAAAQTQTQTQTPKPAPAAVPVPVSTPAPVSIPQDTSVYYANCTAARAAGVAPIYAGQPGYSTNLDRDRDGVACE